MKKENKYVCVSEKACRSIYKTDAFENTKVYYFQFFLIFDVWQMLWCVKKKVQKNPQNIKWVEEDCERKLKKKSFYLEYVHVRICATVNGVFYCRVEYW